MITSHINAPQEKLASHLNDILKPLIQKCPYICKNSANFVQKAKNIQLPPGTKMVSYDAEALFPSVPIADSIQMIKQKLQSDSTLRLRTDLNPTDISDLLTLCLESTNFIFNDRHNTTKDSGPIGLSLMVTVSQLWMIHTMELAIQIAIQKDIPYPDNLEMYVDNSWGTITSRQYLRPGLRSNANVTSPAQAFQDCLSSIHPCVKFTREEEVDGKIAFLDVLINRHDNGSLSTQVYRKETNTNVIIRPNSCHNPATHEATFKGEMCQAMRICASPEQAKKEIDFLLNVYEDNGHDRQKFEKIANSYKPSDKKKQENLFAHLPFHNDESVNNNNNNNNNPSNVNHSNASNDNIELRPFAKIPFIPGGITYQLKRALNKAGCNAHITSGRKLQSILCSRNKSKPDPMQKSGIYQYTCSQHKTHYIGETKRSFKIRDSEHRKAAEQQRWSHSGLTQHMETCKANIEGPTILHNSDDRMKNPKYDLRVREALYIRRNNCGPGRGMNQDYGSYVTSNQWQPVFNRMG